jgi:hypothetical protein
MARVNAGKAADKAVKKVTKYDAKSLSENISGGGYGKTMAAASKAEAASKKIGLARGSAISPKSQAKQVAKRVNQSLVAKGKTPIKGLSRAAAKTSDNSK